MADPVRYELEGGVAVLRFDDGKANVFSHESLAAIGGALDRAKSDGAGAVAIVGRPGRFSAGFDLGTIRQGPDAALGLMRAGFELALRLFESPVPVVLGATGHALAMGAVLLMSADERIGADGDFKVGLNEVAIGMVLPKFPVILARERLSKRHLSRAVAAAEIYTPQTAVDAGFLDRVVPPDDVEKVTIARARELAETLDGNAHAATKASLRAACTQALRASLEKLRGRS